MTNAAAIALPIADLTSQSFDAFCQDIAGMFGCNAECALQTTMEGKLSDLKKEFKKLASVNFVQAQGAVNGSYSLIFDQGGVFVLAGIFVMLPEKRILETIRNGTLKDADYINDAIKEVGNLLVGSWDRVWRENVQNHQHFKQTGTYVGSLWQDCKQSLQLDENAECAAVLCRMKVDAYPEFLCAAVFPKSIFEPVEQTPQTETPTENPCAPSPSPSQPAISQPLPDAKTAAPENPVQTEKIASEEPLGPISQTIRKMTQSQTAAPWPMAAVGGFDNIKASDWMRPCAIWIEPQQTVEEALALMQRHNVSYLLVGKDGILEGILSRSDVASAISPYLRSAFAQWRRPQDDASLQIRVLWFMSRPVHTICPETPILTAIEKMLRHGIRALPVADSAGKIIGILTTFDILTGLCVLGGIEFKGDALQSPPLICPAPI